MSIFSEKLQPAVKRETKNVAVSTAVGVLLMWLVYAVLHAAMPDKVPFDYTVILAGIGGGAVAVLNFLWLGVTVQKAAAAGADDARLRLKASYSQRMLFQMLWAVAAIVAPCFHFVAGLLPLLFPSVGIKIRGIIKK